jgi:acetyl-CoA C-acetyltransferase
VGFGQVLHRLEGGSPLDGVGLMIEAARRAEADAGVAGLLARTGAVLVPEGTWPGGDAGRVVADAVGAPGATTVLLRIGVLQTTPIAWAAEAIASGRVDVALVVGAEARASARAGLVERSLPTGPDVDLAPSGDIVTAVEIERGLAVPAQSYALQEHALRVARGEDAATHRARLDALLDAFAAVAASNPYAWDPSRRGDRMVSTPYTARDCSQWNVDQGVAILLCAAAVADELGIDEDRRVHPWAVVESNAMIPVSERADLHRSPAFGVVGRHLGVDAAAVDHLDLYSCFPSAVQVQVAELGADGARQLTVNGGMSFAGGPLNSAALHAMAAMGPVLRDAPGSTGLVTAVSGMLTKQGASLWSTAPPPEGFRFVDVSDEAVAETARVELDAAFAGEAVVDAATIAYDRDGPSQSIVVATNRAGARVVASGPPRELEAGDVVRVGGPHLRA